MAGVGSGSLVVEGGLDWAPQLGVLGNPGKGRGRNVGKTVYTACLGVSSFPKQGKTLPQEPGGILQGPRQRLAGFLYSQGTFDLNQLPTAESGWNQLFRKQCGLSSRGTKTATFYHVKELITTRLATPGTAGHGPVSCV